jgi:hypothetical protein
LVRPRFATSSIVESIWPRRRSRSATRQYEVRSLKADDLHNQNVFNLVADYLPPGHMDQETIVLVGVAASRDGKNGFDLIAGRGGREPALVTAKGCRTTGLRNRWMAGRVELGADPSPSQR